MGHRGNKDPLDLSELQERRELQDQVGQQVLRGNKEFLVLPAPKAIREKEVTFSLKLL